VRFIIEPSDLTAQIANLRQRIDFKFGIDMNAVFESFNGLDRVHRQVTGVCYFGMALNIKIQIK